MAGRIPQHFIDNLISRVDIVEVVGSRVNLKKTGSNYSGLCPFHNEKTPSFTVSQSKQFYHCFGCGANGSAISFLMEYDNLEFVEAIEELARIAGVEVPRESYGSDSSSKNQLSAKNLYELMEQTSKLYSQWLKQNNAENAKEYLVGRGIDGTIARDFGIGYSPDGWSSVLNSFEKSSENDLIKCGLVIENDNGKRYDRFRDRIMFPIRDRRGRVIAFGGRIIGEGTPKYLNSPETEIFHKGQELYGLYETIQHNKKTESIYVVEGYMDVIALAQYGVRNAVATLGTATSAEHINRLFKVAREVVFCFDGDKAGRSAAWKALELCMANIKPGKIAKFLFLPEGDDPDSLIRERGKDYFLEMTQNADTLSTFFLNHLTKDMNLSSIDSCSELIEKAKPYLQSTPEGSFRELLLEEISKLTRHKLGTSEKLARLIFRGESKTRPSETTIDTKPQQRSPMRSAISFLIHKPEIHKNIAEPDNYIQLTIPGIDLFVDVIKYIKANPDTNTGKIIENWRDTPHFSSLSKLAGMKNLLPDDESIEKEFIGIISYFKKELVKNRMHFLENIIKEKGLQGLTPQEKEEYSQLLIDFKVK